MECSHTLMQPVVVALGRRVAKMARALLAATAPFRTVRTTRIRHQGALGPSIDEAPRRPNLVRKTPIP
jgi:hypothetical protein